MKKFFFSTLFLIFLPVHGCKLNLTLQYTCNIIPLQYLQVVAVKPHPHMKTNESTHQLHTPTEDIRQLDIFRSKILGLLQHLVSDNGG